MLPFALKIAWFSLSLSGLLSCWAVLSAFAVAIRSYWLAILYCFGCTLLQGIFCLGLIWKMDPFLMPRSFCIAQTLLTGFGTFMLTGVCATFSMVTSLAILRPEFWNLSGPKTLAWHPCYIITLIIFPILASVVQITVVLRLDAVQPTDSFACDPSKPIWVRFLGYAGTPFLFSIPFSCLALMAVIRVFSAQRRIWCSTLDPDFNSTNLTSLPPKRTRMRHKDMDRWLGSSPVRNSPTPIPTPRAVPSPSPSLAHAYYPASPGRAPISSEFSSPIFSARQFHLPFSPQPLSPTAATSETRTVSREREHDPLSSYHSSALQDTLRNWESEDIEVDEASLVSSAFPTFAPPSNSSTPPNPRESPGYDLFGSNSEYYHYQYHHHHLNHQYHYPVRTRVGTRYSPTTGWESSPDGEHHEHGDEGDDADSIDWPHVDVGSGESEPQKAESEGHHIELTLARDKDNIDESVETEGEYVRTLHEKGDDIIEQQIQTEAGNRSGLQYITRKTLRANANVNSMVISVPMVTSSSVFGTDIGKQRFGFGRPYSNSTSPLAATPIQANTSSNVTVSGIGTIPPAIWRIIIFQLSFTLILVLASISTLIDVIAHHTQPTPFGTQHVALLLAAWGPALVFGPIPSTQENLKFWKRKRQRGKVSVDS